LIFKPEDTADAYSSTLRSFTKYIPGKLIKVVEEALDHPDMRVRLQAVNYLTDRTEGPITRVATAVGVVKEGVRLEMLQVGGGPAPDPLPEEDEDAQT